jgi:hypothetical protein
MPPKDYSTTFKEKWDGKNYTWKFRFGIPKTLRSMAEERVKSRFPKLKGNCFNFEAGTFSAPRLKNEWTNAFMVLTIRGLAEDFAFEANPPV